MSDPLSTFARKILAPPPDSGTPGNYLVSTGSAQQVPPPPREYQLLTGQHLQTQLGTPALAVGIDNQSEQWANIDGTQIYVAPGTTGFVQPLAAPQTAVGATFTAPPKVTQPASVTGQQAVIRWYPYWLPPNPGIQIPIIGGNLISVLPAGALAGGPPTPQHSRAITGVSGERIRIVGVFMSILEATTAGTAGLLIGEANGSDALVSKVAVAPIAAGNSNTWFGDSDPMVLGDGSNVDVFNYDSVTHNFLCAIWYRIY